MKHKHAELIHAWADGAKIEYKGLMASDWMHLKSPDWSGFGSYRIKPEPKPDVIYYAYTDVSKWISFCEEQQSEHNIKLTFDVETGKLKAAEVVE